MNSGNSEAVATKRNGKLSESVPLKSHCCYSLEAFNALPASNQVLYAHGGSQKRGHPRRSGPPSQGGNVPWGPLGSGRSLFDR